MTFKEVEVARQAYDKKNRSFRKRAWIIYAILVVFGLMIQLGTVRPSFYGSSFIAPMTTAIWLFVLSFFYLIIASIIVSASTNKEKLTYEKVYRSYFVEKVMRESFTDLYYCHEKKMPKEELSRTLMVTTGDAYSSNDFTSGKYKDVNFSQADVCIQEEHKDSDGDKHYVTIFRGRFMIFEFPKKFEKRLLVAGKGAGAAVARSKEFKKLETESLDFNRHFRIYTEDGFEMFYLLDPAMMVRMENINNTYKGRTMFAFYENKLLIGINDGKDSFEPPRSNKPLDEKVELEKNLADVKVITDLVDSLRLNRG